MRLGGFFGFGLTSKSELEPLCAKLDRYGLSAIAAPVNLTEMSDDECAEFRRKANELGIVIGETGFWGNLMNDDDAVRSERIATCRKMLRKADLVGCRCFVSLVGTKDPSDGPIAPHPYMFTNECRKEFREIVLRILDGLSLETTRYCIEPWCSTFFYQPEDIREFIDSVGHPAFGLHLDQMNMVSQQSFYRTTELINTTFDLLADRVASVHLKDIAWDPTHLFLKLDEVYIGDGVLDYETYLKRLSELPPDTPCFCEHMPEERDYALNFARLQQLAEKVGVRFLPRSEQAPQSSRAKAR